MQQLGTCSTLGGVGRGKRHPCTAGTAPAQPDQQQGKAEDSTARALERLCSSWGAAALWRPQRDRCAGADRKSVPRPDDGRPSQVSSVTLPNLAMEVTACTAEACQAGVLRPALHVQGCWRKWRRKGKKATWADTCHTPLATGGGAPAWHQKAALRASLTGVEQQQGRRTLPDNGVVCQRAKGEPERDMATAGTVGRASIQPPATVSGSLHHACQRATCSSIDSRASGRQVSSAETHRVPMTGEQAKHAHLLGLRHRADGCACGHWLVRRPSPRCGSASRYGLQPSQRSARYGQDRPAMGMLCHTGACATVAGTCLLNNRLDLFANLARIKPCQDGSDQNAPIIGRGPERGSGTWSPKLIRFMLSALNNAPCVP